MATASGGHCRPHAADVTDREAVDAMIADVLDEGGRIDILVNNAGIAGPTGKVDEIAPEDWDRCLAIDITGQFNCTRLAVPYLRESKNASIVNLSSAAGRLGCSAGVGASASRACAGPEPLGFGSLHLIVKSFMGDAWPV